VFYSFSLPSCSSVSGAVSVLCLVYVGWISRAAVIVPDCFIFFVYDAECSAMYLFGRWKHFIRHMSFPPSLSAHGCYLAKFSIVFCALISMFNCGSSNNFDFSCFFSRYMNVTRFVSWCCAAMCVFCFYFNFSRVGVLLVLSILYLLCSFIMSMLGGSPCDRSMVGPRVADGRDGFQQWRVAANIFNKQSRTNDKGCYSSLAVGRGANNTST
jgi:hypothetical protein